MSNPITNEDYFKFFKIEDNIVQEIKESIIFNKLWLMNENKLKKELKEKQERIKNRFVIPFGKTKKEYKEILKETQNMIDDLNIIIRHRPDDSDYPEELRDKYIEKKKKLKYIIQLPKQTKELNITKAKQYPIDQLMEFKGGFAVCPFHSEKTGSFKYYKDKNFCFCFGGCGKKDAIDIYQKLYGVTLSEAVKKLC